MILLAKFIVLSLANLVKRLLKLAFSVFSRLPQELEPRPSARAWIDINTILLLVIIYRARAHMDISVVVIFATV